MSANSKNKKIKTGSSKSAAALIYCRVSSDRQAKEGHGLDSQEHRCREYVTSKGYSLERVFRDSSSGGGDFMKRPAMVELLKYVDEHSFTNYVVVFDDLSRFARDVPFHIKLRQAFDARGIKPECLNFNFDDTPEGELVEIIMAAQNQYHRKNNSRQVVQKQKARIEAGYWTFFPPPGYDLIKDPLHGKLLTPNTKAEIIKEAFEGFASGRFREQVDVQKFLRSKNIQDGKPLYLEYVKRLFSRIVYAGYIEREEWGVARRKGHHQAIISLETYERVQEKLGGRHHARSVNHPDFPLRGLVVCSVCHRHFTAGWTTGRSTRYPYYKCQNTCALHSKNVRRDSIEGDFRELLQKYTAKAEVIRLAEAICKDVWDKRLKDQSSVFVGYDRRQAALEREKEEVIKKIVQTQNDAVMRALENKIDILEREMRLIEENRRKKIDPEKYGTALDMVLSLIREPVITWENGGYEGKRLITKLVCTKDPVYDRVLKYGTTEMSDGIKLFELIQAGNSHDVDIPPCSSNTLITFVFEWYDFFNAPENANLLAK